MTTIKTMEQVLYSVSTNVLKYSFSSYTYLNNDIEFQFHLKWDNSLGVFWYTYDNFTLCCPISFECLYQCIKHTEARIA
jgi:hypothetical protein